MNRSTFVCCEHDKNSNASGFSGISLTTQNDRSLYHGVQPYRKRIAGLRGIDKTIFSPFLLARSIAYSTINLGTTSFRRSFTKMNLLSVTTTFAPLNDDTHESDLLSPFTIRVWKGNGKGWMVGGGGERSVFPP